MKTWLHQYIGGSMLIPQQVVSDWPPQPQHHQPFLHHIIKKLPLQPAPRPTPDHSAEESNGVIQLMCVCCSISQYNESVHTDIHTYSSCPNTYSFSAPSRLSCSCLHPSNAGTTPPITHLACINACPQSPWLALFNCLQPS